MEKKPYVVDLSRTIVDTVIVWAETEEAAREFAMQTFVEGDAEFPTGTLWDTEIVDVEDASPHDYNSLQCMDKHGFGYVQLNKPWNSVEE